MQNETLEAKLRNQLSPIYGLAKMILLMEEKPEIKELIIKQAKQTLENKERIDLLLSGIEAKTLNNPDVSTYTITSEEHDRLIGYISYLQEKCDIIHWHYNKYKKWRETNN